MKKIAAGLLVLCWKTGKVLLLRRRLDVPYPNMWGAVAGSFEQKDGSPKQTAIREFKEETKYRDKLFISKQTILEQIDNQSEFYLFLGVVDNEFVPSLQGEMQDRENLDYGWFDMKEIPENTISNIKTLFIEKKELLYNVIKKFRQNGGNI